ncbi:MAG: hydantoinase/oxoprolinase family protein [Pseudomonadota bacterium]
MSVKTKARLAVDIGGTFTDVALEKAGGALVTAKTLTTPSAPEEGVIRAVGEALSLAALAPGDIGVIIHGTTLATNALIEKRGARTALLTSEGHRDALEMAYENRFEQYDVMIDRPPPLVPRWLRLPVRERLNAKGEALIALDERSVAALVPALKEEKVESLAIGFLHSYANPSHERRAAEIISKALPHLSISISAEVAPEIREYERQTTTVANAYVRPLMERYLRALEAAFAERGFQCPFLLVTSGGGLCTVETAAKYPIRLVESGPAGGAVLAASIARRLDIAELLSFDMGGTTAKMCLIDDFEPSTARVFEVDRSYRFKKGSGMPVRIPVIELVEIGAGGGSIAHVDSLKRIEVGPESAGADPGPACYGRGGSKPTVTDADYVLGRIIPENFAGGSISLEGNAASIALTGEIGTALGLNAEASAFGVSEVVDESMASAARAHAVEQGKDIRRRTMIAFGGAAPLHAARLAEKLGLDRVVIPEGAGVGSAIGFLLAPASYEIVRSLPMRLDALDSEKIAAMFAQLRQEAEGVVRAAEPAAALTETRTAFMRYVGQGYEIAVPVSVVASSRTPRSGDPGSRATRSAQPHKVPDRAFGASGMTNSELKTAFEHAYRALYGRIIPEMAIEVLSWSLRVAAPSRPLERVGASEARFDARASRSRDVFDAGSARRLSYGVHDRAGLAPGARVSGPSLIIEAQTTTLVTASFDAAIDDARNIILTRKAKA